MTRSEEIVQNLSEAASEYKTAIDQNLRLEVTIHDLKKRDERIKILLTKWRGKNPSCDVLITEIEDLL